MKLHRSPQTSWNASTSMWANQPVAGIWFHEAQWIKQQLWGNSDKSESSRLRRYFLSLSRSACTLSGLFIKCIWNEIFHLRSYRGRSKFLTIHLVFKLCLLVATHRVGGARAQMPLGSAFILGASLGTWGKKKQSSGPLWPHPVLLVEGKTGHLDFSGIKQPKS